MLSLVFLGVAYVAGKKRSKKATTTTTTTTVALRYAEIGPEASYRFMEGYKKEEGVVLTNSGLMYKVLEKGNGTGHPMGEAGCDIKYWGRLVNGFQFESSDDRDDPFVFINPTNVLLGWEEAMYLMVEGDIFEIVIPQELAYGDEGRKPYIPPNVTVIFKLHLIRIRGPKMADNGTMIMNPLAKKALYKKDGNLIDTNEFRRLGHEIKEIDEEDLEKDEEELAEEEEARAESEKRRQMRETKFKKRREMEAKKKRWEESNAKDDL